MTESPKPDPTNSSDAPFGRRALDWIIANRAHWLRGLLMLAYMFVLGVLKLVIGLMALVQFGSLLLTGEPNRYIQSIGKALSFFVQDIVAFLTCATERMPFPFAEWPGGERNLDQ